MIQRLIVFVFVIIFLCGFVFVPDSMSQSHIEYSLSMPDPSSHYYFVEMRLKELTEARRRTFIDLKMPVWTPGSYLIREYAKNVDRLEVSIDGQDITVNKIRKNVWRVPLEEDASEIVVKYRLYAFEPTVRTNFLDDTHGYITGAATFLYTDDHKDQSSTITIHPFSAWNQVSTSLPLQPGKPFTYRADSYDLLVDSPIEIGTHSVLTFEACGIPHQVAMVGDYRLPIEEHLLADYKRICEAAHTVVGAHPCTSYLFIVHHTQNGRGGLEHLNCTTLQTPRNTYEIESAYRNFMGLVAHEYFHLWNVKRIRPIELGPFDYENENYTRMLWVAEGFTSMYDNHILRRAGISSVAEYLSDVADDFNYVENTPGVRNQSLADASFDAWIKYYRPNENTINSQSSYYTKGAAVTTLLNLEILKSTHGTKSLDDVMRVVWKKYYTEQNRGFTDQEIQSELEAVVNHSLNDFFQKYIYGTAPLEYNHYLSAVGCYVEDQFSNDRPLPFLGATFYTGKSVIHQVLDQSPASKAGLNSMDEILTCNGKPVMDASQFLADKNPDEALLIEVRRNGLIRTFDVTLEANPQKKFIIQQSVEATPEQRELFNAWVWA